MKPVEIYLYVLFTFSLFVHFYHGPYILIFRIRYSNTALCDNDTKHPEDAIQILPQIIGVYLFAYQCRLLTVFAIDLDPDQA